MTDQSNYEDLFMGSGLYDNDSDDDETYGGIPNPSYTKVKKIAYEKYKAQTPKDARISHVDFGRKLKQTPTMSDLWDSRRGKGQLRGAELKDMVDRVLSEFSTGTPTIGTTSIQTDIRNKIGEYDNVHKERKTNLIKMADEKMKEINEKQKKDEAPYKKLRQIIDTDTIFYPLFMQSKSGDELMDNIMKVAEGKSLNIGIDKSAIDPKYKELLKKAKKYALQTVESVKGTAKAHYEQERYKITEDVFDGMRGINIQGCSIILIIRDVMDAVNLTKPEDQKMIKEFLEKIKIAEPKQGNKPMISLSYVPPKSLSYVPPTPSTSTEKKEEEKMEVVQRGQEKALEAILKAKDIGNIGAIYGKFTSSITEAYGTLKKEEENRKQFQSRMKKYFDKYYAGKKMSDEEFKRIMTDTIIPEAKAELEEPNQ